MWEIQRIFPWTRTSRRQPGGKADVTAYMVCLGAGPLAEATHESASRPRTVAARRCDLHVSLPLIGPGPCESNKVMPRVNGPGTSTSAQYLRPIGTVPVRATRISVTASCSGHHLAVRAFFDARPEICIADFRRSNFGPPANGDWAASPSGPKPEVIDSVTSRATRLLVVQGLRTTLRALAGRK